jgi:hypothetical protein
MNKYVIWVRQDCKGDMTCGYLTPEGETGPREDAEEFEMADVGAAIDSCDYEELRLLEARVLRADSLLKLSAE